MKCTVCGMENKQESVFCVNCGSKLEEPSKRKKPLYKKKWFWVLMSIATVFHFIIFAAAVASTDLETLENSNNTVTVNNSEKNFRTLFGEYESKVWCTISADGRTMKLVENPYNYVKGSSSYEEYKRDNNFDFNNFYYSVAGDACGFSGTPVWDRILESCQDLDGGQYENKNYRISWSWRLVYGTPFITIIYEMK